MLRFKCQSCGYEVQITSAWAAVGAPRCLNAYCANRSKLLDDMAKLNYRGKRYRILTELNGETPEQADALLKEEAKDEVE